jgi:hypothetical protein
MIENPEHAPHVDLLEVINDLKRCRKNGVKPPRLETDIRRAVVVHLLDEGLQKIEIVSLLGIARSTLWEDEQKIHDLAKKRFITESTESTAERINRRSDFLYAKAIRDGDLRLAHDIECKRQERLQSIGIIQKSAEKLEIDDSPKRTRSELIAFIRSRIGGNGEAIGDGGTSGGIVPV